MGVTPPSGTNPHRTVRCPVVDPWDGASLDALRSPWTGAARLLLSENLTGRPPLWGTEVRVGWHAGELLVLFLCQDPEPWATLTERDGPLWEEEVVEVFVDPFGDGDCYFEFEVNPLNTVLDLFVRRVRTGLRKDFAWDCDGLRTAAGRLTYGWVAGLAIPFRSFGNWEPTATGWRLNFCRIERPRNRPRELSAWSPTFAKTFHVPERFGLAELA
ncbi:MAG: carbohydrate-binding family 9-like protein [Verrucomicrobia bacterium]|nr:carbohydrate-binding family 9-like protein [Verrucomicrobiota bacterium]